MTQGTDPLASLFIDRQPLDRQLLADLILPYIRLYGDTKEVVTTPEWAKLNLQQKVVTYLLGKKALRVSEYITEDQERMSPAQLENETSLNGNSIRPTLSKLLDERLVRQDKDSGSYWIPDHALEQVKALFSSKERK